MHYTFRGYQCYVLSPICRLSAGQATKLVLAGVFLGYQKQQTCKIFMLSY